MSMTEKPYSKQSMLIVTIDTIANILITYNKFKITIYWINAYNGRLYNNYKWTIIW